MAIKMTGVRSLQDKLDRVAQELRNDANRILREAPERAGLAYELGLIAERVNAAARSC